MMHFINIKNILFSAQYEFREGFSTEHAIVDIVSAIQSNMGKRLFTCGIFIDLKKAFDTVNHQILLNKLIHYGFRGIINNWFESFLWKQLSDAALICNGVSQGSVLGPLLFLLYINDIHTCSDMVSNKLTLNTKKTNFVIFHPYQKSVDYLPQLKIFDTDTNQYVSLEMKNYVKYLGILIDKNLSWKIHIDNVATKLSKTVGLIAKLRHFVPQHTLLNIYLALILPYLSFGLMVWGQASKTHLTKIFYNIARKFA